MFAIFVIGLLSLSHADSFDCKAVKTVLLSTENVYPMDVCFVNGLSSQSPESTISYWYYCSSDGLPYKATYDNLDCSGYPISDEKVSVLIGSVLYNCDGPPCEYVKIRQYTSTQTCNQSAIPTESELTSWLPEDVYISGYCSDLSTFSSESYYCQSSFSQANWTLYGGSDCQADRVQNGFRWDANIGPQCPANLTDSPISNQYPVIKVECGIANFTGLLGSAPTTTPAPLTPAPVTAAPVTSVPVSFNPTVTYRPIVTPDKSHGNTVYVKSFMYAIYGVVFMINCV